MAGASGDRLEWYAIGSSWAIGLGSPEISVANFCKDCAYLLWEMTKFFLFGLEAFVYSRWLSMSGVGSFVVSGEDEGIFGELISGSLIDDACGKLLVKKVYSVTPLTFLSKWFLKMKKINFFHFLVHSISCSCTKKNLASILQYVSCQINSKKLIHKRNTETKHDCISHSRCPERLACYLLLHS